MHIDAKSTVRLPVKCVPSNSLPQEARLVLMSRKDAGATAATLVFLLNSQVSKGGGGGGRPGKCAGGKFKCKGGRVLGGGGGGPGEKPR